MGALDRLRVVDLTRILAGPFCTQLLADMGAEVIKVEAPAGDPVRNQGEIRDGYSWYFAQFNRNKKSVVLDLYRDEDKQRLARLLEGADVVVENFRPGVFASMGFGPQRLEALNERLIHASVNGYGLFEASDGQIAVAPSNDTYVQRFLRELGLAGLLQRPEFNNNAARVANRAALNARINAVTRGGSVEQWIERINAAGCPCGRVMQIDEVLEDPQMQAQQMVIESKREGREAIRMTGFPVKFSRTPCTLHHPPPELGEHNAEYFGETGNEESNHGES